MSSASEPSEPDLELGLVEKFDLEMSSDVGEIPIEPQGDYYGEYTAYADDEWGLEPLASSPNNAGNRESPAADLDAGHSRYLLDSDADNNKECDELDNATAAVKCERAWEPELRDSRWSSWLSSPAISDYVSSPGIPDYGPYPTSPLPSPTSHLSVFFTTYGALRLG
ncbi:hypothetical protein L208DRAFT_1377870 [Tricholoma matsutake]|nr:hypothetical protein L208DRAFT_1377870 [Tricholoma matsutake 945]